MNEQAVAEAVCDWAMEISGIATGYAYAPATKLGGLPDVVAVVTEVRDVPRDDAFPYAALEQSWLRIFDVEISVCVEIAEAGDYEGREAAHLAAHRELQAYGAQLREAIASDATLGGRVPMISPLTRTGYEPPFDPADDETRGRCLFVFASVAERLADPG